MSRHGKFSRWALAGLISVITLGPACAPKQQESSDDTRTDVASAARKVYVAPGDRRTKSGVPGETQNHLVLLAETLEGYHNLIKLVSAGYTEGFYYKPRIDKDLLAQHSKGLIGLSSCLKGEVAEGLAHHQDRKAIEAAAAYRDILGPGNFFLEMQWHGIEEQRTVNTGLPAIARDLGVSAG